MSAGLPERLAALTDTGLLEVSGAGTASVYRICHGQQLAAAYYRNTIVHYFLSSAIAEVALARVERSTVQRARIARARMAATRARPGETEARTDSKGRETLTSPGRDPVLEQALAIRDLLKFEFFFKVKEEFLQDAAGYLDYRFPSWEERGFAERAPLFGPGILRSFIEAYRILALAIVSRGDQAIDEDRDTLIHGCLQRGEAMLRGGEISTEAALAQPLFETAIRLAGYRGLLAGNPVELESARPAFVTETEDLLAAIDDLQKRSDARLRLGWRAAARVGSRQRRPTA
jgi:glycerol-3-phosphate O-acyltransferase